MVTAACHLLLAAVTPPVHLLRMSLFLKQCSENIPLASSLSGLSDASKVFTFVKYIQSSLKQKPPASQGTLRSVALLGLAFFPGLWLT